MQLSKLIDTYNHERLIGGKGVPTSYVLLGRVRMKEESPPGVFGASVRKRLKRNGLRLLSVTKMRKCVKLNGLGEMAGVLWS